jgi:hypothetical protein
MPARRSRGEGALYWDESPQRWMAAVNVGFSLTGRRQRRWVSRKTKTEAKQKLLALRRDQTDGLPADHRTYTVRDAVESWLEHGLTGRDDHTVTNRTILAIPALARRDPWGGRRARARTRRERQTHHCAPDPLHRRQGRTPAPNGPQAAACSASRKLSRGACGRGPICPAEAEARHRWIAADQESYL